MAAKAPAMSFFALFRRSTVGHQLVRCAALLARGDGLLVRLAHVRSGQVVADIDRDPDSASQPLAGVWPSLPGEAAHICAKRGMAALPRSVKRLRWRLAFPSSSSNTVRESSIRPRLSAMNSSGVAARIQHWRSERGIKPSSRKQTRDAASKKTSASDESRLHPT